MQSHFYQLEDVQEILQIALAQKAEAGQFSYEQLLEMANELRIPPEILKQAEQKWKRQRKEQQALQFYKSRRQRGFQAHLFAYIAVNMFLFILNFLINRHLSWAFFPFLGWGLGIAFHAWSTYRPSV